METIPQMETFLIYQMAYYIKQGGFGNFFLVKVHHKIGAKLMMLAL